MRRLILTLLVLVLIGSTSHPAAVAGSTRPSTNALHVLHSDASQISFQLNTPVYNLKPALELDGYMSLEAPGLEPLAQPGAPGLPGLSRLIGVPPRAEIKVVVRAGKAVNVGGEHALAPMPRQVWDENDLEPAVSVYEVDPEAYTGQDWLPAELAVVQEIFWLRGQQVARIEFSPFQYLPAQGRLRWYPEMEVDVLFQSAKGDIPSAVPPLDHDPFQAALSSSLVNYEQARAWQIEPGTGMADLVVEPPPSPLDQIAYKITVNQDGLYKITGAELQAVGLNLSTVTPAGLRLLNQGREVAISLHGFDDGVFNHGDYILFYGEKFRGDHLAETYYAGENEHWETYIQAKPDNSYEPWKGEYNRIIVEQYTDENVYWLMVKSEPGLRMGVISGSPEGSTAETPTSYRVTHRAEESRFYFTNHFTSEDIWFWDNVNSTLTRTFTTTLSAIVDTGAPAILRGEVVGHSHNPSVNPDQRSRISWNNAASLTQEILWDGRSRMAFDMPLAVGQLNEGLNTLYYQAVAVPNVVTRHYFDWFEVEYDRGFVATNNQLDFVPGREGGWKYQVSGFTSDSLHVYDITNPLQPITIQGMEVSPPAPAITATFAVTSTGSSRYLIASDEAILSPLNITSYNSYLRSAVLGADYVFISHPDFITATQILADYRATQGLRTRIVNIEDIYNEFSFGIRQPMAIKDFLRWVFLTWTPPAPVYVALVGDGTLNPRGYAPDRLGNDPVFMLPHLSFVDRSALAGLIDSTNLLGAVVGDDPLADVALSRIPVNSPAEMMVIVNKIKAYESAPIEDWQRNLLFIADLYDPSAGDFEKAAEDLIAEFAHSGFSAIRLYTLVEGYSYAGCTGICEKITDTLNTSSGLLMVYAGHGATKTWGSSSSYPGGRIYQSDNVPLLTNAQRLPILISLDCWDGNWYGVNSPTTSPGLAEALLREPDGGVIAAYSPVALSYAQGHDIQAHTFFSTLLHDGVWDLAAAVYASKLKLLTLDRDLDQIHNYNILGDPALRIKSPYRFQASAPIGSLTVPSGTQANYSMSITNTGAVTDTYRVLVSGNIWPVAASEDVVLAPGETGIAGVTVSVPSNALTGERDVAQLTVISTGDKAQIAAFRVTTSAVFIKRIMIPLLLRFSP
jgi:hypothetical protein